MNSRSWLQAVLAIALLVVPNTVLAASKAEKEQRESAKTQLGVLPKKMPEPAANKSTPAKIELGKQLL